MDNILNEQNQNQTMCSEEAKKIVNIILRARQEAQAELDFLTQSVQKFIKNLFGYDFDDIQRRVQTALAAINSSIKPFQELLIKIRNNDHTNYRKNYLDNELSFLFKNPEFLSPLQHKKRQALINHIYSYLKSYKVNHVEPLEILAIAYEKGLKTIEKYPIDNPYGWVKKAVIWIIKDIGRKYRGKEPIEYNDGLGETLLHNQDYNFYKYIDNKELIDRTYQSLNDLDSQIIHLYLEEGYTLKEIPFELVKNNNSSLSYDAVRKRCQRSLKIIRTDPVLTSMYRSLF